MDIIKLYDPHNSHNLSDEDIKKMQTLTRGEIKELAETYRNRPIGNSYLVLYDKNEKEHLQRYPLSTWENLNNLYKLGRTEYIPFGFSKTFFRPKLQPNRKPVTRRVVDLSDNDLKALEGIKKLSVEVEKPPVRIEERGGISESVDILPEWVHDESLTPAEEVQKKPAPQKAAKKRKPTKPKTKKTK